MGSHHPLLAVSTTYIAGAPISLGRSRGRHQRLQNRTRFSWSKLQTPKFINYIDLNRSTCLTRQSTAMWQAPAPASPPTPNHARWRRIGWPRKVLQFALVSGCEAAAEYIIVEQYAFALFTDQPPASIGCLTPRQAAAPLHLTTPCSQSL